MATVLVSLLHKYLLCICIATLLVSVLYITVYVSLLHMYHYTVHELLLNKYLFGICIDTVLVLLLYKYLFCIGIGVFV